MSHLEPDRLVLQALGEDPRDGETGHLDGCETWRTEIAELWTVAGIGRETQEVRDHARITARAVAHLERDRVLAQRVLQPFAAHVATSEQKMVGSAHPPL